VIDIQKGEKKSMIFFNNNPLCPSDISPFIRKERNKEYYDNYIINIFSQHKKLLDEM
jgi:hypothetical protein